MAVQRAVTTVATLSGLAFGQILTAIDPCPVAPSNLTVLHASCIVTEQHQPISTCTSASNSLGWSTYAWVDTTIPCWGSIGISSCTVTQTDQVVPCTASTNTITSIVPTSTNMGNGTYKTWNVTGYTTVSKLWQARYKDLGGLAIPGYDGCGLCTNCALSDGSRQQMINVFECLDISGQAAQCSQFVDTWVSSVCPFTTGAVSAAISSYTAIPSRGVYTWYFPQPAPTTTIQSDNQVYTVPAQPWTASFTRSFAGPTNCAIVSTVTKSLIYVVPLSTISATDRATVTDGQQQWANWYGLKTTSRATTSLSSQGEWSIWASLAQSQQSTSTSTTATSTSSEPTNTAMSSSSDSGQVGGITTTTATLTAFSTSMTSASTTTTLLTSTSPSSTATLSTSTSSMSSTLTSTSSTLTTTGGQTQATTFVIQLTSAGLKRRYTKRTDVTYLCFLDGSDNASTCLASQDAARFSFDSSGYLRTGNLYISDVSSSAGYFVFERTSLKPVSPPPYTRGADGAFIRTTAGGFCATPSNFFVSISNSPSNCTPVTAVAVQDTNGSSTTSTSMITSTNTGPTATTNTELTTTRSDSIASGTTTTTTAGTETSLTASTASTATTITPSSIATTNSGILITTVLNTTTTTSVDSTTSTKSTMSTASIMNTGATTTSDSTTASTQSRTTTSDAKTTTTTTEISTTSDEPGNTTTTAANRIAS